MYPTTRDHGAVELVYRYTVIGSDKASIDTGVDTPDAGTNDWTNGDLLEILFYVRTDQVIAVGDALLTFNNDSGATQYVQQRTRATNAALTTVANTGTNSFDLWAPGASFLASVFGMQRVVVPNYAGTVGFKTIEAIISMASTTAGDGNQLFYGGVYRSTSAITRVSYANTSTNKFKVGSQLLIYKRLS